jgi:hypothetical protein
MSPTKATKKPAAPVAAKKPAAAQAKPAPAKAVPAAKGAAQTPPAAKAVPAAPAVVAKKPVVEAKVAAPPVAAAPTPPSTPPSTPPEADGEPKKEKAPSAIEKLAQELITAGDAPSVLRHLAALEDDREAPSTQAARLVAELTDKKPELLVPLIERFARLLLSKNRRVVQSAASALAPLSRIAPAKVAKQLPVLTQNWAATSEEGKDGLVRTFAGLCTASVAYQKRLEPALALALGEADPKLLIRWTEIVLPALKGEPHARARAVVEDRLYVIPRPQAQKIADFLGIKLRPVLRP